MLLWGIKKGQRHEININLTGVALEICQGLMKRAILFKKRL